MEKVYTETTYVICHNGADIIHPAKVEPGTNLATGQPHLEEFADEAAWTARLAELGYDVKQLAAVAPGETSVEVDPGTLPEGPGLLTPEERATLTSEEKQALRKARRELKQAQGV